MVVNRWYVKKPFRTLIKHQKTWVFSLLARPTSAPRVYAFRPSYVARSILHPAPIRSRNQ
jgi:hypothetical protein